MGNWECCMNACGPDTPVNDRSSNGGQLESGVDQVSCDAEEADEVAEAGHAVVPSKRLPVGPVLWVLLLQLGVVLPLAAQPHLVPQTVLLLHRPHLEHDLGDRWAEPLGVQACRYQRHEKHHHLGDERKRNDAKPSEFFYHQRRSYRCSPARLRASPAALWGGTRHTQPGWWSCFPAGSRSRQETACSGPNRRYAATPASPERNLRTRGKPDSVTSGNASAAPHFLCRFRPRLPPMKETHTCMPQVKASSSRCNTLIASVGSPSVAMASLRIQDG